jgi:HEAT repeat protein
MSSEFLAALDALSDEATPITPEILQQLSGLTRADAGLFGARFAAMPTTRRREIATLLAERAERDFMLDFAELFIGCLEDADATVRCRAVEGLWEDERAILIAPLVRLLRCDPHPAVRAAAAVSLGRFVYRAECDELDERRGEMVRQALRHTMDDPEESIDVTRRALESLAHIADEALRRLIDRAYCHGDERLRESALFAMGRSADRFWSEIVLGDLLDPSPAIRYEAVRASGELQLRRAVPQIIELGDDADREVQLMAMWALGQIGGKRARAALQHWAAEENEARSVAAVAAVAALEEIEFANVSFDLLLFDAEDGPGRGPADDLLDDEDEEGTDDWGDDDELSDEDEDEWPDEFLDLA